MKTVGMAVTALACLFLVGIAGATTANANGQEYAEYLPSTGSVTWLLVGAGLLLVVAGIVLTVTLHMSARHSDAMAPNEEVNDESPSSDVDN